MRTFLTVLFSVFLAEFADKTQLAVFSFATTSKSKLIVLLGAITALSLSSVLAVLFGDFICRFVSPRFIRIVSGTIFIAIGLLTILLKDF